VDDTPPPSVKAGNHSRTGLACWLEDRAGIGMNHV
jgi:hypothetical protein